MHRMKKTSLLVLAVIAFTALVTVQAAASPNKTEPWPGVTKTVAQDTLSVSFNNIEELEQTFEAYPYDIACLIICSVY